jgi:hypothetical protein
LFVIPGHVASTSVCTGKVESIRLSEAKDLIIVDIDIGFGDMVSLEFDVHDSKTETELFAKRFNEVLKEALS